MAGRSVAPGSSEREPVRGAVVMSAKALTGRGPPRTDQRRRDTLSRPGARQPRLHDRRRLALRTGPMVPRRARSVSRDQGAGRVLGGCRWSRAPGHIGERRGGVAGSGLPTLVTWCRDARDTRQPLPLRDGALERWAGLPAGWRDPSPLTQLGTDHCRWRSDQCRGDMGGHCSVGPPASHGGNQTGQCKADTTNVV